MVSALRRAMALAAPNEIDSLGCAALILDEQDRALRWNREFLALFPEQDGQIHRGEPYEANLRRFYLGRLDAAELAHIERYVAAGVDRHHAQSAPYEFVHRDRWLRVSVVPLPGVGKLRFWEPAAPPLDCETLAARVVDQGKQVVDGVIDQIADGLVLRDGQGRIVIANRRLAEIYGLASPAEAIGMTFPDLLGLAWADPAGAEDARRHWTDNARFPGAPFELPLPGDRWVRVRERRTHDGGLIGTHVDVTDLYRLRRRASEAQKQAEGLAASLAREVEDRKRTEAQMVQAARMVALGQMATGLAHELNQPLAAMVLAADSAMLALQRSGAAAIPEALRRLESIAEISVRARGIVDHLRIFGREEDAQSLPEPIDLRRAVTGALTLTQAAIRSAGITLDLSLPPGATRVMGKPVPLEQVIMNLLLNARDAITEKRVAGGTIRLAVAQRDGAVVLTIADNGGGFSEAAMLQALEPFFTTKEMGKGTGIGLSLAYATVSAMGGTITLGNADGGAVVRITLPALGDAA